MTVFVSRGAIDAAWSKRADKDICVLYRDVIVRARMSTARTPTRMCILRGEMKQLRWIACDLAALAAAALKRKGSAINYEALMMRRAARKIENVIKRNR